MELVILVNKTKQFGVYLAKMREKSGYKSQRSLAIDAGISPATLSRIESGTQKPTPETLKALSRFLRDVTYEELLEKAGILEDSPSPSGKKDKPINRAFLELPEGVTEEEKEFLKKQLDLQLEIFRSLKGKNSKK
jgi:HTH-type transcriptional regulator, competence development regulator